MADVQPLTALRYELARTGGLQDVLAPPYDVIDAGMRRELEARSPYNVVRIDLPRAPSGGAGTEGTGASEQGGDPYAAAAELLGRWRAEEVVVREQEPAFWALAQTFTGPDGRTRTRSGCLARVRVEEYGAGRIRAHERTHPGPREDRLRLTRATRANLSPIFSLFDDPDGAAESALADAVAEPEWAQAVDDDGTVNRLWRVAAPAAVSAYRDALQEAELLIADGHHRYETARVYAEEIGGEGPHRYVLMCLVALQDPGLTVFPTHRLIQGLDADRRERLDGALRRDFEVEELADPSALTPAPGDERVRIGYITTGSPRAHMLTLRDQAIADAALPGRAEPYRRLDTAVLEALILKGTLGMSDEDIDHLDGLGYARNDAQALELVRSGEYDAAFFMAPTPVERVREVAAAGESMPPKSTYFFPKVPTGLLFNPLD